MSILKFASIDIGSNAVRLLISNVIETDEGPVFKKASLTRIPLRLGEDSFSKGYIGNTRANNLKLTMKAFKHLIDVQDIISFKAFATSAMREASNSNELIEEINDNCGIDIDIIDGKKEAQIIYETHAADILDEHYSYLYVDVGGGSTEMTLFSNNKIIDSYSFDIGTIRILKNKVKRDGWENMEKWVKKTCSKFDRLNLIGTGGNINKLYKLSKKKENKSLTEPSLEKLYNYIKSFSFDERIRVLNMNPDRADVILPATEIFLKLFKWTGAERVHVPKIGLVDGTAHMLYSNYLNKS